MSKESFAPPSRALFFMEGGRAIARLGAYMNKLPSLRELPEGDGHPVIVMPGFLGAEFTTYLLRSYLRKQGYDANSWGLGMNMGREDLEEKVNLMVAEQFEEKGEKVTLIGWSLGGVYARESARAYPDMVRQVITLGSPFNQINRVSSVSWVYEMIHKKKISDMDPELIARIKKPLEIPSVNIFSKSDGVVPWRCCVDENCPRTENIEVDGSHLGLGHNPQVLSIIADRLARAENRRIPNDPHTH